MTSPWDLNRGLNNGPIIGSYSRGVNTEILSTLSDPATGYLTPDKDRGKMPLPPKEEMWEWLPATIGKLRLRISSCLVSIKSLGGHCGPPYLQFPCALCRVPCACSYLYNADMGPIRGDHLTYPDCRLDPLFF
jgi:hypothetical protein